MRVYTADHESNMGRPKMGKRSPPKAAVEAAGHELKVNPPAVLSQTKKKKGAAAARKQRIAIMLSKARKGK